MSTPQITVLVVGATGSIGRLVVKEAVRKAPYVPSPAIRETRTACSMMWRWSRATLHGPTR
jgi:uncharacterized protein YbjT (DUF2867 family)